MEVKIEETKDQATLKSHQPQTSAHPAQKKSRKGCWWATGIAVVLMLISTPFFACAGFMALVIITAPSDTGFRSSANEIVVREGEGTGKIAVIPINGVITQGENLSPFGGESGAVSSVVISDIVNAYEDPDVKAVVLWIESPGGEAVASDIIYQQVKILSQKKPVVVYSSQMVASGGYMIAMGSDYFMTHEGAITGSIGVIIQAQSLAGLYEKLGIETVTFKSGDLKDSSQLFDGDPNSELDKVYQDLVDETYESFLSVVKEGRGMTDSQARALADGRIYSGRQAVENGLIDETGYMNDAYDAAERLAGEEGLTVVEYSHYNPWGDIFGFKSLSNTAKEFTVADQPGIQLYYLVQTNR